MDTERPRRFLRSVAVLTFGALIPERDVAVEIGGDDRVVDLRQNLRLAPQGLLGLLALRDVADDGLDRGATLEIDRPCVQLDHHFSTIQAHQRALSYRLPPARQGLAHPLRGLLPLPGSKEVQNGASGQFLEAARSGQTQDRVVGGEEPALPVHDDGIRRGVEQSAIAPFALGAAPRPGGAALAPARAGPRWPFPTRLGGPRACR